MTLRMRLGIEGQTENVKNKILENDFHLIYCDFDYFYVTIFIPKLNRLQLFQRKEIKQV